MIINQVLIKIQGVDARKTIIYELSSYTLNCMEVVGKTLLPVEIFQVSMDIWED